jgi:hypothetical protein
MQKKTSCDKCEYDANVSTIWKDTNFYSYFGPSKVRAISLGITGMAERSGHYLWCLSLAKIYV